ncbi:hypothetical protein IJT17_05515 [bacterium]|nr:hypothetical protein [bacterium]
MIDSIILALPVIGCCLPFLGRSLGKSLCRSYNERYAGDATVLLPSILQGFTIIAVLIIIPDEAATWLVPEPILSIIALLISHALGLWMCIKHAMEQGAERKYIAFASIAQMLLPLSNTILWIMAVGVIASLPLSIRALVVDKYLSALL